MDTRTRMACVVGWYRHRILEVSSALGGEQLLRSCIPIRRSFVQH
jgi:hypothetical protein